jgi:hypothetical protein
MEAGETRVTGGLLPRIGVDNCASRKLILSKSPRLWRALPTRLGEGFLPPERESQPPVALWQAKTLWRTDALEQKAEAKHRPAGLFRSTRPSGSLHAM